MILGLDVSTSCTGWAVVNKFNHLDGLVAYGAIKLKSKKLVDMLDKADEMERQLQIICETYDITEIYIEEILNKFAAGKSTAKVIATLAKFNGIVTYISKNVFKIKPKHIAFVTARSKIGIRAPKGSKMKEIVMAHCLASEPTFSVVRTKKNNIQTEFYDMADAIVIARAAAIMFK